MNVEVAVETTESNIDVVIVKSAECIVKTRRKLSGRIVGLLLQRYLWSSSATCRCVFMTPATVSMGIHLVHGVLRRSSGRIVTKMEEEALRKVERSSEPPAIQPPVITWRLCL